MPRHGKARHTDEHSPGVLKEIAALHATPQRMAGPEGSSHPSLWPDYTSIEDVVALARSRGDGVFRLVPKVDLECWYTWAFTTGRWAGHYIAVVQTRSQTASETFTVLARKLDLVDQGLLRPSRDKYAANRG